MVHVQTITETGLSDDSFSDSVIYTGGTPYKMAKPMFAEYDDKDMVMKIAWPPVHVTRSAQILSYVLRISATNWSTQFFNQSAEVNASVAWPPITTPEQPI